VNSKDYRATVLTYIEILGEIDKLEDQLTKSGENKDKFRKEIEQLKKEVNELKQKIDSHKRKN